MLENALRNLIANTAVAVRRFPLPVLFSAFFCIVSISSTSQRDLKETILYILFCGGFWFIALKLFAESRAWTSARYYLVGMAVFAVIAWHLSVANDASLPFHFLGSGLFLSIFIAPFLNKQATSEQIWVFNYRLWIHIGFTILAAIVLYLGLCAVIASLDVLFGISFYSNFYGDVWLVVATFFSPLLAMAGIPKQLDETKQDYPKAIRIILSYIMLPLLCIYAVILYGYGAKILVSWELPKGNIAYLISAFGATGIIAYLASYPLHREQGIIGLFSRYFFKLLLVPLVLLAIGIGIRIREYGVTEERYGIALCLVWLALSALCVLTKPSNQGPKLVFSSIVILLIAASFGPWSAVSVSTWSQLGRLETLLEKNQVLVKGAIQKPKEPLSGADRVAISSVMDYVVQTKKTDYMKPWFAHIPDATIHKTQEEFSYGAPEYQNYGGRIVQDMGIDYVEQYNRNADVESVNFSFHSNWWNQPSIDIAGYDILIRQIDHYTDRAGSVVDISAGNEDVKLHIRLTPPSTQYVVTVLGTNEEVVFNLEDLIVRLNEDAGNKDTKNIENFIMEKESSTLTIRLIVNSVYGKFVKDSKKPQISSINSSLMIKRK